VTGATPVEIAGRSIGPGRPVYIVAEMSANHSQRFEDAVRIVEAAHAAGADAVKLQTYRADTITIDSDAEPFRIRGTLWQGETLYRLYDRASGPWEWQPRLKAVAAKLGLTLFSTPFDETAVDFLETMDVPAYKVASFELVHIPLLRRIARTRGPIILSTGMATFEEIADAVGTIRDAGGGPLILLKCTSEYPAAPEDMNLRTIPHMAAAFGLPVGLSDHTLDAAVPVAAVALGACLIEKHLTLSRAAGGPDARFSLEPDEFRAMVEAVRTAERALGTVYYGLSAREEEMRMFRPSLFVVRDVRRGEPLTPENVRVIRPGQGLHPRHLPDVIGRKAARDLARGAPLAWDMVEGG
jgi:pseudaminic acid synthase